MGFLLFADGFGDGYSDLVVTELQVELAIQVIVKTINIPPYNGGYFSFGQSPKDTGGAQVRFLLACQPCNCYLLPVNGSRGSYILS